jgi:hypothetical protein
MAAVSGLILVSGEGESWVLSSKIGEVGELGMVKVNRGVMM